MAEVSSTEAAEIVDTNRVLIFRHVDIGVLPARRVGIKREIRIDVSDLRAYAEKLGYRFDEALAAQYAK